MLGSNADDSFHPADYLPSLLILSASKQLPFFLLEQTLVTVIMEGVRHEA